MNGALWKTLTEPLALIQGIEHMTGKIPKSSQFLFYLMLEEISEVMEFIVKQDCMIFSDRSDTNKPCEIKASKFKSVYQIFFCPREVAGDIKMFKAINVFFIEPTTSPVIEFDSSGLGAKGLSRGRIYFRGGYDGRGEWVAYPARLYEVFEKVTAFMKKSFLTRERKYGGYLSKKSLIYVAEGGNIVQF